MQACTDLGPIVQSIVKYSSKYNIYFIGILAGKIWVAFANAEATHIFSTKMSAYMPYLMIKVLTMLTKDTVSFEQLGPACFYETNASEIHN